MVNLIADQSVPSETYRVCRGGEYDEYALVEVYREGDPDKKPMVAFHAGYIAQGNDFYKSQHVNSSEA